MSSKKLWLWVSLSSCLGKKKKVKVVLEDEDFEAAFNSLREICKKQLESHIRPGTALPELVMVYKPDDKLEGDDVNLDDADDFEGMLEEHPLGKGVRIIINTEEFEDRSYFAGTTMQENMSKSKVLNYLENQLSRGAAATDSESDAYRSSRTSSPSTSQPRKKQKSSSDASKSIPSQSSKSPNSAPPTPAPHSQDQGSVSPSDYLNQFDSSGKEGDSSAESLYPQDSTGSSSLVVVSRPPELPGDNQIEMKDEFEGGESVVVLSSQSSPFPTNDRTEETSAGPNAVWSPDKDKIVPLTSSVSCDTESEYNSSKPPVSSESVKLLFEEEEKKTLEDPGDGKEPETSVNPPESTPAEEESMEPLIESSKEKEGMEPLKRSPTEEESMETVIQEDGTPVKNETTKETVAVKQGGVDGIEEEMKEFVSCDKESSVDEAVEDKSVSETQIVPGLGNEKQVKASKDADQKDVEGTAAEKQEKDPTPEGKETETFRRVAEAQTPPENGDIPSVTQSGQLFSKDKVSDSKSESSSDKTKDTKPPLDEDREMSAQERQLVLRQFGDSLQFSNVDDSPTVENPDFKNNMTYSPSIRKLDQDRSYKRPAPTSYSAILIGQHPQQTAPKRNRVSAVISGTMDALKQTLSDTYNAVAEKISPEKINVCFIIHANVIKGQYLAVHFAVGGTKAQWNQKDCEEMNDGNDSKVYRVVIENVPENARIFYKFFKYSPHVIINNQLRADWEYLDRNQFPLDSHNHANRVVNVQNESTTVYVAVKFNSYVPDTMRLKQYVSLIRVIESQNNTLLDFCTQLNFFVSETLIPIPEAKKLFKENFESLMKNLFAIKSWKNRLMLLWILPHFSRRIKGQDRKNTLSLTEVKQSGKLLLPLIDADLQPEICVAVHRKFEMLVTLHREDCPEFVIPFFVFKEKVRNMPRVMDEDDDFMMMGPRHFDPFDNIINFQLGKSFFDDNKQHMEKVPGLLKFCARSASVDGLLYLVQTFPKDVSLTLVIDCISSWNIESLNDSYSKEKEMKASIKKMGKHILDNLDSEDVTEKIENILLRIGRRLHESNVMRKNYKMETRSWRNFGGASKDDIWSKTAITIFSALWQCYIISSIKWKHSIKDVHSALLNTQPLNWWISVFEAIGKAAPLSDNGDDLYTNSPTEVEDFFLDRFKSFLNNLEDDEKTKLIKEDSFLDAEKVPQKMITAMISSLQSFIIRYIKDNQRFYNYSPGFVKALKEILIRKFGHGIRHSHLLISDPNEDSYFPWETIFDLTDFKDNDLVKDAKGLLKDTFDSIRSRETTLLTLQKLVDESNSINERFQFLVSKAVKVPITEIKTIFADVSREFEEFQMTLRNCQLLIDAFGQNKRINVLDSIPKLDQFSRKKIKEIWTQTETAPKRLRVLRKACFADLSDAQIMYLRFVKMVEGSKLYNTLILRQFNEINPKDCNMGNLLTELVIKAYDPAFSRLRHIIEQIRSEQILQADIREIFGPTVPGYKTYEDVRKDLLHICHAVSDLYPDRISDKTFKKLEIILSDLKSAFECLDSIKETLNITSTWKHVENLRKTVCKERFDEPLKKVDATLELSFFYKIRDTRELVNGFARSQEFINWIKEIAKDEKDVGTFIDLANTLEDTATSDRLSGLHRIILAIRPLVFDVRTDGKFADFQKAFDKMYDFVKGDTKITERLIDVTENLKWFKEMQDLQTDTTKSSISQVENMKAHGRFLVGSDRKRIHQHDFFEERKIEDLLRAEIVFEGGETRLLRYKDLKELNDKLVLISGQANYHDKVLHFTQVFGKLTQICEVFKELNECGHPRYQRWSFHLLFNNPAQACEEVNDLYKKMLQQLKKEKEDIENKIREYEALTNFTRLQLLYLRSRLSSFEEDRPPTYYTETLILLQAINPQIAMEDVKRQIYVIQDTFDGTDHQELLSMDQLGKVLKKLEMPQGGDTKTLINQGVRQGMITLLKVPSRDVFRCVLSLFMHANRVPTAEEVLCCTSDTTEEQISVFLRRAIFSNNFRQINCLVSPEKLSYQLNKHFVDEYERLSKNSTSTQLNYLLLVITVENIPCEIASTYVSCHKQFPLGDPKRIKEFTARKILRNERCVCDPDKLSGRLIQSEASGNGKTRKANLIVDEFSSQYTLCCVPIHKRDCDRNMIVKEFLSYEKDLVRRTIFLVDVSPSVRDGADVFIFELLILKKVTDSAGRVFRPFSGDYVLIEGLFSSGSFLRNFSIDFTPFLPVFDCLSPKQSLQMYDTNQAAQNNQMLLEARQFRTEKWQRVYQYLTQFRITEGTMEGFQFSSAKTLTGREHERQCVETFLRFVKIQDPSWRELDNFVCFLNTQLLCYENSYFTNAVLAPELGVQFNAFVVKFMIKMCEEFATRSLNISEGAGVLEEHALEKLWDKTFHPYLFFNNDRCSFTFIGFKIQAPGDLVDVVTDEIRERNFMNQDLLGRLRGQRVTFKDDLRAYTPELLMNKLESVLDLKSGRVIPAIDYQLTLDNTIKILAIHMRMRSNIPVVIMGETGCGKTRLIAFMCDIIKQSFLSVYEEKDVPENVNNLITLRVHGGVTSAMISDTIVEAEEQAKVNKAINDKFETIVFFDEANATSEIDLIREIMCNHTINGRRINSSIRFIAAVNPYRKHTPEMIELLKKAGLGYRTGDAEVVDRIGDIPLRELVYRVHPLPPSLKPLIWDFGAMDNDTEKQYIKLIITSRLSDMSINEGYLLALVDVISGCQDVLRRRSDQCSFVSLRDVNRFIQVFKWFQKMNPIFAELAGSQAEKRRQPNIFNSQNFPLVVLSAINAIGVCYYVRISARQEYLDDVATYFRNPFPTVTGPQLQNMILRTQRVILHEMLHNSGVHFPEDVAENEALTENIFMMVVCIELNIPLFIVGHPGSSKSLAKLIVKGCMSGLSSNSQLLEHLCQIHMTSFQCSPQSEAEGIERSFESARKFISDETNTQNRRVMPVVVLDEIGLAEDSKKMPLKALHSLLENGGTDNTKIGFIGISNWSLDPAKMNRGLYVTRQLPDLDELKMTAIQICKENMRNELEDQLGKVAKVYMDIYEEFSTSNTKSYIGLRDFYCLVKHLCRRAEDKGSRLTDGDILNGVYRNFGGICPDANRKVMTAFEKQFKVHNEMKPTTIRMIRENLQSKTLESGSRYLLIVTPNLETTIDTVDEELRARYKKQDLVGRTPQIKFNSDFPDDADYTKRCKIINDVKNSIERGDDILLIDMEMIYESLYDVLNQYYKEWQGKKYVEIALESHRVNCRVHDETKIILLARPDQAVKFPIPLLNRMEKHYFTLRDSMTLTELSVVRELEEWVKSLTRSESGLLENFQTNETFIGYHQDTTASYVKTEWKKIQMKRGENRPLDQVPQFRGPLLNECKMKLLRTVSYDGLVRFSLSDNAEFAREWDTYYEGEKVLPVVKDLASFIKYQGKQQTSSFFVVSTYSHLPAKKNIALKGEPAYTFNVEEFGSQGTFESAVQPFFQDESRWLIILVPPKWHKLLSYMRFHLQSSPRNKDCVKHVIIITQLLRNTTERPALFHSEVWDNVHIEDLNPKTANNKTITRMSELKNVWRRNIPQLFQDNILDLNEVLGTYKEQVVCNIANPFPHLDLGVIVQDCMTSGFLQEKITSALQQSLEQTEDNDTNWIQKAAVDKGKLSESTSFQNVLMLKVSESLTYVAASIIADIDRDGNAALRSVQTLTDFWEQMLNLMPNWSDVHAGQHVLCKVQHNFLCSDTRPVPCQFPFSWLIKERLDEMSTAIFRLTAEGDSLGDMVDNFLNEFNQFDLYELLSQVSENVQLRQDLNRRYLSDYVNMVYAAQSDLEFQIAYRILETSLPEDWQEKHVAECAVLIQIYHLQLRGESQLEALRKTLTVYTQEINDKDISCFEEASQSTEPLFTLCNIVLSEIEKSIDNVMRTNNFTMPIKLILDLHLDDPDRFEDLMNSWDRVRFKNMNREFVTRMNNYGIPRHQTDTYYVKMEHVLTTHRVPESVTELISELYDLIRRSVDDLALDSDMMEKMWECENCHVLTHDQIVTPCKHVFCKSCYENLPNMQCVICREPLFEDSPPLPTDNLRRLVKLVIDCCGGATSFLSQVIVTFLSEQRLHDGILQTLSILGKGRVQENRLLRSVTSEKIEALQTLIFTIFVRNQLFYRDQDYSPYISESCQLPDHTINVTTLAKLVTISQDVAPRRDGIPDLITMYRELVDLEEEHYIQGSIYAVSGIRQKLTGLVRDVAAILDDPAQHLSHPLVQLRDSLFQMGSKEVYTLKLFLLKQIFNDRGVSVISKIMEDPKLRWISPVEEVETQESDVFTLLGPAYTSLRNELAVSNSTNNGDDITDIFNEHDVQPLQSVAATYYVLRKSPIPNNIKQLVQQSLNSDTAINCFTALCTGDVDPNTLSGVDLNSVGVFRGPLTLLYLSLQIRCRHPFLRLLESIRMNPEQSENKFLPGMRDNSLAAFIGNLGENNNKWKWYRCSNGHAYAINNCGRPMQRGRCACGAEIGGENHQFANNTNTAELTQANNLGFEEKGYNLLPPDVRVLTDTERTLPPLLLNIVRWFIHASYLLSQTADQYKDRIFKLGNQNISIFLLQNMQRDLEGMRHHLNAGPDECILFLVKMMIALTESPDNVNYTCNNKRDRDNIEGSIMAAARPLLDNPTGAIRDAQVLIVNDLNVATDPLVKQLYEFEDPPDQLASREYHCRPELWRNSQPLNLELFCNSFSNTLKVEDQARYPTVRTFVQIRDQVPLLLLFPKILEFFKRLLSRYSYKLSLDEARKITIRDAVGDDPVLKEGFTAWAEAWKRLDVEGTKFAIPDAYKTKKIIEPDEPLSLFLPEPVAREGICCLHLMDSLIVLHNELVKNTKRKEVKLSDRFLNVNYDEDRTDMFLLYSHSVRLVGKHREVRFSYQVFEQYLLDEVLGGVHPISVSMKQFTDHDTFKMTYREDITWSELCNKLNSKEPQKRIPESIKMEFGDIRSATEAKKALATAIGFIRAGLGQGSQNESLVGFMERIGCFSEQANSAIPDSLKKCHVLDAWYLAYFYKSYRSTYDPFESVDMVTTMPPELKEWFEGKNRKIIKIWLMELHRFLVDWVVLKAPADNENSVSYEGWDVMGCLDFYREQALLARSENEKPELPDLPDELLYEHSVAFWLALKEYNLRI